MNANMFLQISLDHKLARTMRTLFRSNSIVIRHVQWERWFVKVFFATAITLVFLLASLKQRIQGNFITIWIHKKKAIKTHMQSHMWSDVAFMTECFFANYTLEWRQTDVHLFVFGQCNFILWIKVANVTSKSCLFNSVLCSVHLHANKFLLIITNETNYWIHSIDSTYTHFFP